MYKKSSGVRRYLQSVCESTDVTRAVLRQSIEAIGMLRVSAVRRL